MYEIETEDFYKDISGDVKEDLIRTIIPLITPQAYLRDVIKRCWVCLKMK